MDEGNQHPIEWWKRQVEEIKEQGELAVRFSRDFAMIPAPTGIFGERGEGIENTFDRVKIFFSLRERGYSPESAASGVITLYSGFRRLLPYIKEGVLEEIVGKDGKATPSAEKIRKAGEEIGEKDLLLPFNTYLSLRRRDLTPESASDVVERLANLSKLRKDGRFGRVLRYYGRVLEAKYEIGQAIGVVERAYQVVYGLWFTLPESRQNLLDGLAESEIKNVHGVRVFEEMLGANKKPKDIIKEMGIRHYFKTPVPEPEEPPL